MRPLPLFVLLCCVLRPALAQWRYLPGKDLQGGDVPACKTVGALTFTPTSELCQRACLKAGGAAITWHREDGACHCKCQIQFVMTDSAVADSYIYLPYLPALGSPSPSPIPSAASTPSPSPGLADVCIQAVVPELSSREVACPSASQSIAAVVFSSFGQPSQSRSGRACSPAFAEGVCHATTSRLIVESLCLGRKKCQLPAVTSVFGDPCPGRGKRLVVEVFCNTTINAPPPGPSPTPSPSPLPSSAPKEFRCSQGTSVTTVTTPGSLLIGSPRAADFSPGSAVNLDCGFAITAPVGHAVALSYLAFSAFPNRDFASVFDGTSIAARPLVFLQSALKNNTLFPTTFSSGRSLYLRFQSTAFMANRGFIAVPAFLPRSSTDVPPSPGSFRCALGSNFGVVEQSGAVVIAEPGVDCSIAIRAPLGQVIALSFLNNSLAEGHSLIVYEGDTPSSGNLALALTNTNGNRQIAPLISSGSSLLVQGKGGIALVATFLAPPKPFADGSLASTRAISRMNGWAAASMRPSPSAAPSVSPSMLPKTVKSVVRLTIALTGLPNWDAAAFLRSALAREALVNATAACVNLRTDFISLVQASVRAGATAVVGITPTPSAQANQPLDPFAVLSASLLETKASVNSAATGSSVGGGDTLVVVLGISLLPIDSFGVRYLGDPDLIAAILGTGKYSSAVALNPDARMRAVRLLQASSGAAINDPESLIRRAVNDGSLVAIWSGLLAKALSSSELAIVRRQQQVAEALANGFPVPADLSLAASNPASDPSLQAFRASIQSGETVAEVEGTQTVAGPGAPPEDPITTEAIIGISVSLGVILISAVVTIVVIRIRTAAFIAENNRRLNTRTIRALNLVGAGGVMKTASTDSVGLDPSQVPAPIIAAKVSMAATSQNAVQFANSFAGGESYLSQIYRHGRPKTVAAVRLASPRSPATSAAGGAGGLTARPTLFSSLPPAAGGPSSPSGSSVASSPGGGGTGTRQSPYLQRGATTQLPQVTTPRSAGGGAVAAVTSAGNNLDLSRYASYAAPISPSSTGGGAGGGGRRGVANPVLLSGGRRTTSTAGFASSPRSAATR